MKSVRACRCEIGRSFSDCEALIESIEALTDFRRGAQICTDRPLIRSGYLTHPAPGRLVTVTADRALGASARGTRPSTRARPHSTRDSRRDSRVDRSLGAWLFLSYHLGIPICDGEEKLRVIVTVSRGAPARPRPARVTRVPDVVVSDTLLVGWNSRCRHAVVRSPWPPRPAPARRRQGRRSRVGAWGVGGMAAVGVEKTVK